MKVTIALPQVDRASNISRWQARTSAHFPLANYSFFAACWAWSSALRATRMAVCRKAWTPSRTPSTAAGIASSVKRESSIR